MNVSNGLWFLRPYLFRKLRVRNKVAYLRFFNSTRPLERKSPSKIKSLDLPGVPLEDTKAFRSAVQERIIELKAANALTYPRIDGNEHFMTCAEFQVRYKKSKAAQQENIVLVRGLLENSSKVYNLLTTIRTN